MHDKITINTWIPVSEFWFWAVGSWIGALVYLDDDDEFDRGDCYSFDFKLVWSVTICSLEVLCMSLTFFLS
jgi:hypothetical protein